VFTVPVLFDFVLAYSFNPGQVVSGTTTSLNYLSQLLISEQCVDRHGFDLSHLFPQLTQP